MQIRKEENISEDADIASVTLVRNDLLDDPVRGDWHQVNLHRLDNETGKTTEATGADAAKTRKYFEEKRLA